MKRSGSILVEFVILLPILVVFLAGIYAMGQYIDTKMKLEMAARIAAQQVANPKLSDPTNAMYYPYGPDGGLLNNGFLGKNITGFLYNVNYGIAKKLFKNTTIWKFIDPADLPVAFRSGREQAQHVVEKYLRLSGLRVDSSNFKLEVRVNPTYVATQEALLPYNNNGDRNYYAFNNGDRSGGARENVRRGVASVHPAYWRWDRVQDHQNRWVKYPHSFSDEFTGAPVDPNHGEEPKHFDRNHSKYTYNHYTFPVGGWIVIAKIKYRKRIPIAGDLVRIASVFMNAKPPSDSVFDYIWLDGTAAFPAPMSIYDIMDADSALHKAQMEAETWQ